MRRTAATTLLMLVLGTSACAEPGDAGSAPPPSAVPSADSALPAGWRWESYGGVEVGVPGAWGWGNGSQRLSQWCIATKDQIAEPIVGRPGVSTLAGCPAADPAPDTLLANTGTLVSFDRTTERDGVTSEGDQTTVRLNGVLIAVNAPGELREQIVRTARRVDVDSHGCPTTHPISDKPQHRPAGPVSVAQLTDVSSVSACRFQLAGTHQGEAPRLVSSLRLDGAAAAEAVRRIAQAPAGGGPDNPEECLPEVSYGGDVILLLVTSVAGVTEIVARYSGCDHNGLDDGVTVRKLTAEAMAPLIAGPNMPSEFSGSQKPAILAPK